jgi:hypothetical protein
VPSVPRRLPPTPEERLSVITTRMAGGSNAGSTRWAQPLGSSNYRAEVAQTPQAPEAGGSGVVIGQHLGLGTGVPYICNLPVAVGTQWAFTGTVVLICNADLPAGAPLLTLQQQSAHGSALAYMTCPPGQFTTATTDSAPYNVAGQNTSLMLNSTAGDSVTYFADGTAPVGFGFITIIQLQGIVSSADSGGVDDSFVILPTLAAADELNNYPAIITRAGVSFTQLTDTPEPLTPPDPGDGGGGGDIDIS